MPAVGGGVGQGRAEAHCWLERCTVPAGLPGRHTATETLTAGRGGASRVPSKAWHTPQSRRLLCKLAGILQPDRGGRECLGGSILSEGAETRV